MTKKIFKQIFIITTMILFISVFKTTAFAETGYEVQGNVKGLTIIVNFSDIVTTASQSDVDNMFNQTGYSEHGNKGSIKDYFSKVSYGELEYTNKVVTYTSPNPKSFYDIDTPLSNNEQAPLLVKEALESIVANDPSAFSELTTQNGEVALTILYAGTPTYGFDKGLWPHQGTIGDLEYQGLNFDNYALINIENTPYIGVIVHETGHMLCNWPDTYNPPERSPGSGFGAGNYDLMATRNAIDPLWPNPYFRNILSGWGNVKNLNDYANNSDIIASAYYHDVYMFTPDSQYKESPNEFFLIENINDSGMPDTGLLIWHIDKLNQFHTLPIIGSREYIPNLVSVVQADGFYALERGADKGSEGDLFSRYGVNSFTTTTTPVNSNLWDGTPSYLYITNISEPGTAMAFKYSKATDIEKPTAPSNVRISNRNGLQIQLNWDSSTDNVGVSGYHVYADVTTLTGTTRQDIGYPIGNSLNFTIEADKSYSFYVTARDIQRNESDPSSAFIFSTNTLAPQAPTGLSCSSVTSNSANLNWKASTSPFGNVAYKIYDGSTLIGDTKNLSYSLTGLIPNTSHSYTVKSYVPSYESIVLSPSSNVVQVNTRAAAVNNFILKNYTGLQANFTWDASVGATKYHLYGTKQSTLIWENPTQIDFYNTNPFYILNLQPNTYYKFYVKAVDASGYESDESNEIIICTDNITPEAITNLTASDITASSVKLSWDGNNDPFRLRKYRIYDGTEFVTETTETNITLTGLAINSTHSYTVIAVGYSNTLSEPSNAVSVTAKIAAPTNFHCVYSSGLTILLGWDSTDGADHYRIYADKTAVDGTTTYGVVIKDTLTNTTSFSVDVGFNYSFYIVAVDATGIESIPSSAKVSFDRR